MRYSKYNIFSRIRDSANYFIVNLLTGNADILTPEEAGHLNAFRDGLDLPEGLSALLADKGYLIDESGEKKLYTKKYLDFIDSRDNDEIQIFFVTNYTCNFACPYCYQDQYVNPAGGLTSKIIDAFFEYVSTEFTGRRKYITIFGGEPLLGSPKQKELIRYVISGASNLNTDLSLVTNGYTLEEYVPLLTKGRIREVQVTLDGTAAVHDGRRFLKGGGSTFDNIVRGIDACIRNGINVNLRMVIDKANISNLAELARFAIDKGWTGSQFFKTQLGRNYELHHCQSAPDMLFDRISMYEKVYDLTRQFPHIAEFYKPAYSVAKFLSENGELPDPLFDACPACKTEWAFDYTGNIYSCTATVGKKDESLGTFYPSKTRKNEIIENWQERDITAIPECRDCNVQLACGGGCGSVAKNRTGNICATDCRPVDKLLELGFSAYLENQNDI